MSAFHDATAPQLMPSLAVQSYASQPCWKDATPAAVKFHPISKRDAARIWTDACELERRTAIRRVDAFGRVHVQGVIGRCGLAVLRVLIFDFMNWRSGRLDPSYDAIGRRACVSRAAVTYSLRRLKAAGVINWIPRCTPTKEEGRYIRRQDTNAYAVLPSSTWRGFWRPPETPAPKPHPETWGAAPPHGMEAPQVVLDRVKRQREASIAAARDRVATAARRPRS